MRPQKVQVFALGEPKNGTPKDKRRYRVKWRIDGRDKTRVYKTKGEAEHYRAALLKAVAEGQVFDVASGGAS